MIHVDWWRVFALLAWAALIALRANAQAVAVAQVEGQVLDSSGAVVPNADVTMTETARASLTKPPRIRLVITCWGTSQPAHIGSKLSPLGSKGTSSRTLLCKSARTSRSM